VELHIGLDDSDSLTGGCTTHLATLLACSLQKRFRAELTEPINLVRLNPSIPWKTRGNGAVALRIRVEKASLPKVVHHIEEFVARYVEMFRGSLQDPGVAITINDIPKPLSDLYRRAVRDAVPDDEASRVARKCGVLTIFSGKGIVGALAAIGWGASRTDYSYELLVYRSIEKLGLRERCIDVQSLAAYESTCHSTFNNFYQGRALITPHGPDPVLYGFRGYDAEEVLGALSGIRVCEPVSAYALFITNQGTDEHVRYRLTSSISKVYRCGWILASVARKPKVLKGGHVLLSLLDEAGFINAIIFRETGFSKAASSIPEGARVLLQGCFKPYGNSHYLHVEKLIIVEYPYESARPRRCPRCGSILKYLGRGRGYRCRNCGLTLHLPPRDSKVLLGDPRLYLPPPHRQKHLVKPLIGYIAKRTVGNPLVKCYEPLSFL